MDLDASYCFSRFQDENLAAVPEEESQESPGKRQPGAGKNLLFSSVPIRYIDADCVFHHSYMPSFCKSRGCTSDAVPVHPLILSLLLLHDRKMSGGFHQIVNEQPSSLRPFCEN